MDSLIVIATIYFRIAAIALLLVGVMPSMYREATIENGFGYVRKLLFILGVLNLVTIPLTIVYGICRLNSCATNEFMTIVSVANSIDDLFIAVVLYLIYHKRYN